MTNTVSAWRQSFHSDFHAVHNDLVVFVLIHQITLVLHLDAIPDKRLTSIWRYNKDRWRCNLSPSSHSSSHTPPPCLVHKYTELLRDLFQVSLRPRWMLPCDTPGVRTYQAYSSLCPAWCLILSTCVGENKQGTCQKLSMKIGKDSIPSSNGVLVAVLMYRSI